VRGDDGLLVERHDSQDPWIPNVSFSLSTATYTG
jgi:hypothetical protein